ncbi:GAF domain-containing sensor histidine kinase [Salinibacter altiplanensis]|uniref:sensor histidine kinase n=1 Tax=Salinibacter altiplanensis TaxID=1803181 RepID=UPI001E480E01|nr:GAF domain-containing sensor histidine kinase [Salinibacter altiplanensis]
MSGAEADGSFVQKSSPGGPSVFRRMYRIAADREATVEEKIHRLIDLGRTHLELPYGFLTRVEGPDGGTIYVDDEEAPAFPVNATGARQRILYASGEHAFLQAGKTCPLSEAYCRKTVRREELLAIHRAPDAGWTSDPAYERFGLGAYIGARIVVEGELYGTFCFASREPRECPFSEKDEAFVELLTRWASYELERQRSREQIEQFAELVTHDLRNPLTAAQMSLHMADRHLDPGRAEGQGPRDDAACGDAPGADDSGTEKLGAHLDKVENALVRMEAIIADTLALAHGDQRLGPDDLEPVPFEAAAKASWNQAGREAATFRIEHDRGGSSAAGESPSGRRLCLLAHEGRLRQLLENLFRNAIDHAGPGVTLTAGRTDGGFFVADDGPGIPPKKRATVFEAGYSTRKAGTGLGLPIVQSVAKAHGWSLSVSESASGGARFEVTGVERPTS